MNLQFFILVFQNTHFLLKLTSTATELQQKPKFDIFQKALFYIFKKFDAKPCSNCKRAVFI